MNKLKLKKAVAKKVLKKKRTQKRRKKESRGRKPHIQLQQLDQIYKVVNQVQISKNLIYIYFEDQSLNATAENILKDVEMNYEKQTKGELVLFKLIPNFNEDPMKDVYIEAFDDEVLEDGNLF